MADAEDDATDALGYRPMSYDDDGDELNDAGYRPLNPPEPEPQRKPVTQDDVNSYMQALRAPVESQIGKLELKLQQLRNRLNNITEESARAALEAHNEADFQSRWQTWRDTEYPEPTYRGRKHATPAMFPHEPPPSPPVPGVPGRMPSRQNTILPDPVARLEQLRRLQSAGVEPMLMAPASVVSSVFSKFYETGLHAQ